MSSRCYSSTKILRRGSSRSSLICVQIASMSAIGGLAGGSDRAIWQHAREHGLVIVSKDEDFQRLSVLYGAPPKVIWIRLGNCSTAEIIRLLSERRSEIDGFLADEEAAFLALA
jgi:predicted nuclease of predicted toxin-antitoxin system